MPFNKIGGGSALAGPGYPISLAPGQAFMLPAGQGVVGSFGAVVNPQIGSGNIFTGQYALSMGLYSQLQMYDPTLNYWRTIAVGLPWNYVTISSDGQNYRVINSTGTPVAALITNAGSAYTNGFYGFLNSFNNSGNAVTIQNGILTAGNTTLTVTPSAGGSTWNVIVGGAINTTISVSGTVYQSQGGILTPFGATTGGLTASGGANYTRPPIIMFTAPPNQGAQPCILPTATCTISGGAINAVTVVNQGAGLLGLPGIVVVPQPGDTTGGGAILGWLAANNSQVGSGTILAMWPSYNGTAVSAVPTFTFSPASTTAVTAIMNWSVTSITNTTPGVGYTNAFAVWAGGIVAGAAANSNAILDKLALPYPLFPPLSVVAGTGVSTLASAYGGANIQAAATIAFGTQLAAGTVTTVAVQTPVFGGNNDTLMFLPL
ncbi:MAG TPA: hypothetical protein VF760_01785 [Xanthobacteraceae bacterium]